MSQYLLCKTCSEGMLSGFDIPFEGPREFRRIIRGIARQPTVEQRTIYVNDVPQPVMDLAFYNCDLCFAEIRPGDEAAAQTVWREGRPEPPLWESAYLEQRV